jgi:hypothetical protein
MNVDLPEEPARHLQVLDTCCEPACELESIEGEPRELQRDYDDGRRGADPVPVCAGIEVEPLFAYM